MALTVIGWIMFTYRLVMLHIMSKNGTSLKMHLNCWNQECQTPGLKAWCPKCFPMFLKNIKNWEFFFRSDSAPSLFFSWFLVIIYILNVLHTFNKMWNTIKYKYIFICTNQKSIDKNFSIRRAKNHTSISSVLKSNGCSLIKQYLALKPLPLRAQPSHWQKYPESFSGLTCESLMWSTKSCSDSKSKLHWRRDRDGIYLSSSSIWWAQFV